MKRRVTVTEGRPQQVAGVRIDVRRKPRHKRQFVLVIETVIETVASETSDTGRQKNGWQKDTDEKQN